jgi:hypothetical protein
MKEATKSRPISVHRREFEIGRRPAPNARSTAGSRTGLFIALSLAKLRQHIAIYGKVKKISIRLPYPLVGKHLRAMDYVEKPLASTEVEHLVTTYWQPRMTAWPNSA